MPQDTPPLAHVPLVMRVVVVVDVLDVDVVVGVPGEQASTQPS